MRGSRRIDTAAAKAMPGVLGGAAPAPTWRRRGSAPCPASIPLKNRDGTPRIDTPRLALADGMVRHVGDPVAFVVAETIAAGARRRRGDRRSDYDVLPAATDLATAIEPGQPQVWAERAEQHLLRLGCRRRGQDRCAFAQGAAHVTRLTRGEQPRRGRLHGGARRASPTTTPRDQLTLSHQHPGLLAGAQHPGRARLQGRARELPRGDPRCRRRLRHEAVPVSRARAGLLRRARARSAP